MFLIKKKSYCFNTEVIVDNMREWMVAPFNKCVINLCESASFTLLLDNILVQYQYIIMCV